MTSPADDLRTACQGLLDLIEGQLEQDGELSQAERDCAPATALRAALAGTDLVALVQVGRAAKEWIIRNADEDEAWDWAAVMPQPDMDRFDLAVAALGLDDD